MLLDFFVSLTSIKSTLSDIRKILTNTIIDVFWNQTIWQNFRLFVTNTVNTKLLWWNSFAIRIFQTTVSTIKVAIHSVVLKVWIFWEGHKIRKNLPLKIWCYSVASNFKWKFFSNFVAFSEYPNFIITEPVTNQDFVTLWNKKTKDMFVLVALKLVKSFIDLSTQRLSLDVFIVWLLGFLGFMLKSTFVTFPEIWKEKKSLHLTTYSWTRKKWYFVTIIVLTYCEKKLF